MRLIDVRNEQAAGYMASLLFAAPPEEQLEGLTVHEKSTPRPDTV